MSNKTKGKKFKISELTAINSHIENLMVSPLLGIEKSLILHKNKKLLKPILEDVEEKLKVITKQCYKTNEKGEMEYDDKGKMIPLEGKMTEYRAAYQKVMDEEKEFIFHPLNIAELPKAGEFGKVNGVDIFQFIPPLFDIIFFEASEYTDLKNQLKD